MAQVLRSRTPLTSTQLHFLRAHILRVRLKAEEVSQSEPEVSSTSARTSSSEDSGAEESATLGSRSSEQNPSQDTERATSAVETSAEQVEVKNVERGKEGDTETPDDIAKQIESLQGHLESLKSEKHRLFQQLKMVLHEEDEKRMKDLEQKQELVKSMAGEYVVPPLDPRLVQASTLGKHPYASSPTTAGVLGQPPPLKKQVSRGPLLPTPETPYMRQSSTGPYRHHSNSDAYNPQTHSANPYPTPAHHALYPGESPSAVQRTTYQDQPQDIHMQNVLSTHPPPPITMQSGITFIQQPQPQFQGVPLAAANYQYSTSTPFTSLPSSQPQLAYQQQQQQQQQLAPQLAPPIPSQGYQALPHPTHQQMYAQSTSQEVLMQQQQQPSHYHSHEVQPHPQYLTQGSGGQLVAGGPAFSDLAPPPATQGPYSVLAGNVQDPRQQKLLLEHQRSGGSNPLKQPYTKQESHQSSPSTRDRKHD